MKKHYTKKEISDHKRSLRIAKKNYLKHLALGDVRSMQYDKNRPNITRGEYLQALNAYMRDKNKTGIRVNM